MRTEKFLRDLIEVCDANIPPSDRLAIVKDRCAGLLAELDSDPLRYREAELQTRIECLERTLETARSALLFYADESRYGRLRAGDHLSFDARLFDPVTWGGAQYHVKPHPEEKRRPGAYAREALQQIAAGESRNL